MSPPEKIRATEAFIEQNPATVVVQQSLFEKHFTQTRLLKAPVVFELRAANSLDIPFSSCAMLDLKVEGIKITGQRVVIVQDEHCTHPYYR